MEKLFIDMPVIVEGKYDKIRLTNIIDADIITTDGFGIFNNYETTNVIRRMAEKKGVIVLTDSDGAGLVIRSHINSVLPKDRVINLFVPQKSGKEKRKKSPSKEGFLGVEGIDDQTLRELFLPLAVTQNNKKTQEQLVTKADLYADGLLGQQNSAAKRKSLQKMLSLPTNISSNMLLDLINLFYSRDEYKNFIEKAGNFDE